MSDPESRAERGLDCLSTIAGSPDAANTIADYFSTRGMLGSVAVHTALGEIWARKGMSRRDRSLVVISTLVALGRERELQQHVAGGLNHGLSLDEIDEIILQCAVYVGLPFALGASHVVDAVAAEREGAETRSALRSPATQRDDADRRAAGLDVLSTLVGAPGMDGAAIEQAILDSQGDMGVLVMDYAFGDVWARPQLSRRDRSLVVISALTALNLTHELEIHLGGALNHGVTPEEIDEVMLTMVAYGGFPRAIDGQNLARKVLAAREAANGGA